MRPDYSHKHFSDKRNSYILLLHTLAEEDQY
jgi:hypothetical protein